MIDDRVGFDSTPSLKQKYYEVRFAQPFWAQAWQSGRPSAFRVASDLEEPAKNERDHLVNIISGE